MPTHRVAPVADKLESAMEHFDNDKALTGNITLIPKLSYDLTTRCSGLEYGSSLIWLNSDVLQPFHIDLYTREG